MSWSGFSVRLGFSKSHRKSTASWQVSVSTWGIPAAPCWVKRWSHSRVSPSLPAWLEKLSETLPTEPPAAHQATERTVNAERQAASVVHQAKQTRSESASQKSQTGVTHQQVASSTRTASVSSLRRESQHSVGLGGRIFTNSMLEGGRFANDVIGMVAAGDLHSTGSITGEFASQALSSYMGITAQGDAAPQISYSDVEIGGGRITGTEYSPEHPEGISFGMYHTGQYAAPDGEHQKVFSADGAQWYKQYAVDTVIKKPFTAPDGEIDYHKEIVKKMPDPPKRKDRM